MVDCAQVMGPKDWVLAAGMTDVPSAAVASAGGVCMLTDS